MHVACGTPDDPYHTAAGLALIGGMVRRIRQPGCKFDEAVTFISEEGYAKGEMFKALAPDPAWFTDETVLGEASKELVLSLSGKCLVEIAEMNSRGTATEQRKKAMLSRQLDRGRTAYARVVSERPRRNVFVLTSNQERPLNDPTGGRRYLPVRLERHVDVEYLRSNRDQLIAEAAVREAAGETFRIPQSLWAVAAEHQEAARDKDDAEMQIEEWFGETEHTAHAYITAGDLSTLSRLASWRVSKEARSRAMKKLGFRDMRVHVEGKRSRIWARGIPTARYTVSGTQPGMPQVRLKAEPAQLQLSPPPG
jgi:predicted P-loop ATPase